MVELDLAVTIKWVTKGFSFYVECLFEFSVERVWCNPVFICFFIRACMSFNKFKNMLEEKRMLVCQLFSKCQGGGWVIPIGIE